MSSDLYAILGVSKTASAEDIRAAYKRKAKASHPDLHPDDEVKSNAFKAASSAYEILGDADKRAQYDRGEIDSEGNPRGFAGGPRGAGGGFGGQSDPFEDLFGSMFGAGRRRPGPIKGQDIRYRVQVAFVDAVLGAKREMTMGDGRTLSVSIPAGIETGQTLRLKSQGRASAHGGPPGDALLEISIADHPDWSRNGDDLNMRVSVPLKIAVLGGTLDVETPGGSVTLKIPEGSNSGAMLRLRGKGVQRKNKPGHLYARLEIVIEDPKDSKLRAWAKKNLQ